MNAISNEECDHLWLVKLYFGNKMANRAGFNISSSCSLFSILAEQLNLILIDNRMCDFPDLEQLGETQIS